MNKIFVLVGSVGLLFSGAEFAKARQYDPDTGRFLQEDPIFYAGESQFAYADSVGKLPKVNLYEYARNNPLKYIDPMGADATLVEYTGYGFGLLHFGYRITDPTSPSGYTYFQFSPQWGTSAWDIPRSILWAIPGAIHADPYARVYDTALPQSSQGAVDVWTRKMSPQADAALIRKFRTSESAAADGRFRYNAGLKNCLTYPLYGQ